MTCWPIETNPNLADLASDNADRPAQDVPGGAGRIDAFDAANVAQDMVNRPNHYAPNGVDTFMHMKDQMGAEAFRGFLQGNAIKYIQRYALKGKPVEDLTKAAFYLFHLAFDVAPDDKARQELRQHVAKTLGHAASHYGMPDQGER